MRYIEYKKLCWIPNPGLSRERCLVNLLGEGGIVLVSIVITCSRRNTVNIYNALYIYIHDEIIYSSLELVPNLVT